MLPYRLRDARENKGLTQQQLARLCNLGINQINKYENGVHDLRVETLKVIAHQLHVSTDYLLGLTDEPTGIAAPSDVKPEERELLDMFRHEGWRGVARLSVEKVTRQDNP